MNNVTNEAPTRELSDWEKGISEVLAPLGWRYWPHPLGSGYWWNKELGMQLTNDLDFLPRGAVRCWYLKWIDGLKVYSVRFPNRKRVVRTEREEIVGYLAFLYGSGDEWKKDPRWAMVDYS